MQEVYHDWTVTCRQTNNEAGVATSLSQMNQEWRDKKSGQLILSLVLNPIMKDALRRGERALVSMMSADQDRPVNVSMSLRDFTAAERRLVDLAEKFN